MLDKRVCHLDNPSNYLFQLTVAEFSEILESAKNIAVVGCSNNPGRTSHSISRYLISAGYNVIPVNPNHDEILGQVCYPSVQAIPKDVTIDIVNIFRRPAHTADMVRDVLERIKETDESPVIWTQIGVSSNEANQLSEEAGLPYVKNRCIMVEHARFN